MIQRNSTPARTHARAGFTLLELVGVMVVIAILTAAVLPSTIDLIRVQRAVDEAAELPKVAEALKRGMLREQVFPIYQNDASLLTDNSDAYCWWNLAARHGGGSANELRYPLGVRPGADNTRKLYFAEANWGDDTLDITLGNGVPFAAITGTGLDKLYSDSWDPEPDTGWIDPADPHELRLLLLSTTNPDLPLPDSLSNNEFNKFWNDWAIGSDGNPMPNSDGDPMPNSKTSTWSDYGLSAGDWQGRAAELNIERIDLRDWLCTVVIENRRAILEKSGDVLFDADDDDTNTTTTSLDGNWDVIPSRPVAYAVNQVDSEIFLEMEDVHNGSGPSSVSTKIKKVLLTKRGRIADDKELIKIIITGSQDGKAVTDDSIQLTLTNRAPIALLNPNDADNPEAPLSNWANDDDYIQNRYFLRSQELLLDEPWTQTEVGRFTITEPFSSLRFDGLQWQY